MKIKANGVTVHVSGLRIDQIDYQASRALTDREGHCVSASHGLHSVRKGETHCCKCGALFIRDCGMQTDWGGNGILSPTINGDR